MPAKSKPGRRCTLTLQPEIVALLDDLIEQGFGSLKPRGRTQAAEWLIQAGHEQMIPGEQRVEQEA